MVLKNSFVFLEGISLKKEKIIWQQGISDWSDFLKTDKIKGISKLSKSYYERNIQQAFLALEENNSSFFVGKLRSKHMWRLYDYFREQCCFLDIETDSYGRITLVGISNYYQTNQFVKGSNLELAYLQNELKKYKLLITFNGSSFDLPKLKKEFNLEISYPHIDLKGLCPQLELSGGLKEVEKKLQLKRPAHLYGNPVDLWKAFHASADREYLDLLLEYNREDIENLKQIMDYCYGKLKERYITIKNVS